MLFCSKAQGKRIKLGEDAIHHDLKLVSDFLKEANEDILFEIFVRLPNCRSAVLSSSVCHRWHSLISQPQFIPRFISHHREHQDRYSLPYTIIFRKAMRHTFLRPQNGSDRPRYLSDGAKKLQPICKLFSEDSMFLHGKAASSSSYLDFLPSPMLVRASCNDVLLVSSGSRRSRDFYICNPITKQFYQLPEIRMGSTIIGYALVCMPECSNKQRNHFKVVQFHHPFTPNFDRVSEGQDTVQFMTIFSSKSGKWKTKSFHYPRPKRGIYIHSLDVVACNGILYWLEYEQNADRVISLDLLKRQCSVIDFPDDFWWFRSQEDSGVSAKERIGVVGGELRLLQVVLTGMQSIVNLKVWKLNSSWVLVHDKKYLKMPSNVEQLVAPFVHPTNGDVVFMVWGKNVFQNNLLMEDTYEMIDELQQPLKFNSGDVLTDDRLLSFPMVHPTWPTPLPSRPRPRHRHQRQSV